MRRTNRFRENAPAAMKKNSSTKISKRTRRLPAGSPVPDLTHRAEDSRASENEYVEAMLLSPTTAKRRVESQERTPTRQQIAKQEKVSDEMELPREEQDDVSLEARLDMNSNSIPEEVDDGPGAGRKNPKKANDVQSSIDLNSNSVRSPGGRNLLKQLQTTLSPKLTAVNTNDDRRVSRYGRHQKQKENINYVPVEIMKFLSKIPPKIRAKKDTAEMASELVRPDTLQLRIEKALETEEAEVANSEANSSSLAIGSPLEKDVQTALVMRDQSESVLGMDAINIIAMNVSFENVSQNENNFLEAVLCKKPADHNVSSDVDSATGTSIGSEVDYREGRLCWAAQKMKTVHWPCIIRFDPETNQITRKHLEKSMEIHVAFFGDRGRRGWIRENCMLPFEGFEDYRNRAENLTFGRSVKTAMRVAMRRSWKVACDQAEAFRSVEMGKRLERFDRQVKLERIRAIALNGRVAKDGPNEQQVPASGPSAVKRERSTSPESPAYELLPCPEENVSKKIRLEDKPDADSPLLYEPTAPRFAFPLDWVERKSVDGEGMDPAGTGSLSEDSKCYTEIVYKLIVNIGRKFLIGNETDGKAAELLQHYAQRISSLQTDSYRKAKRTTTLRKLGLLRKLSQIVDATTVTETSEANNTDSPIVRIKKEKLTLEEEFIFKLDPKILIKGLPKGYVCYICERPQNVVKCGNCQRHVHLVCLTVDELEQLRLHEQVEEKRFNCTECVGASDIPSKQKCFICSDATFPDGNDEPKYRCTGSLCSRQFHLSCLRLFPQCTILTPKTIICPYHVCHTCVADDPRGKASNAKATLVRCIKCPSAYHPDVGCIPAGSEMLTAQQLICPKHSLEQINVNVNWCSLCCKGGNLICCESCPNAFHRDCLPFTVPEGKYFCEECESGRLPLYNEIVIAKFGNFRWWPALIVPPSEIPPNLLQQRHIPSSVCVKFFQSHTVAWLNRRRMYLYQHDDSENLGAKKSGSLDKQYRIAMAEASKIYETLEAMKSSQVKRVRHKHTVASPMYTKIKVNRYIAPLKQPPSSTDSNCNCRLADEDPCGPTSACINRAMMIECIPKSCPARNRCGNQRFCKKMYPPLEVCHFADKGYGLVAKEAIECGQFVIEYVGEVINSDEFNRRIKASQERQIENYYFLTVEPDMTIDAGAKGNVSRFINHSCEPNCETQKWSIGDTRVIGLFAIKDIKPGEELTFNYNLESLGKKKRMCLCGAVRCSGFIGEKYRPPDKGPPSSSSTNHRRFVKGGAKKTGTTGKAKVKSSSLHILPKTKTNETSPLVDNDVEIVQTGEPPVVIDLGDQNAHIELAPIRVKKEKVDDDDQVPSSSHYMEY